MLLCKSFWPLFKCDVTGSILPCSCSSLRWCYAMGAKLVVARLQSVCQHSITLVNMKFLAKWSWQNSHIPSQTGWSLNSCRKRWGCWGKSCGQLPFFNYFCLNSGTQLYLTNPSKYLRWKLRCFCAMMLWEDDTSYLRLLLGFLAWPVSIWWFQNQRDQTSEGFHCKVMWSWETGCTSMHFYCSNIWTVGIPVGINGFDAGWLVRPVSTSFPST